MIAYVVLSVGVSIERDSLGENLKRMELRYSIPIELTEEEGNLLKRFRKNKNNYKYDEEFLAHFFNLIGELHEKVLPFCNIKEIAKNNHYDSMIAEIFYKELDNRKYLYINENYY